MEQLLVEYMSVSNIKEYRNNARIHTAQQIEQIVSSIKTFNFNNPVLIDDKNEIIAGHGRFLAAKQLQMKEIPVIRLKHLTESQKRAYRIADNKLTENGKWDTDLLKLEFSELETIGNDFSLDITGFEAPEIDIILSSDNVKINDKKLNTLPFIAEQEVVSKRGDIWLLGNHKIICADSLKEETFIKLLGDKKADMILTDPPYNVKIDGHVCGNGIIKHKEFAMASGEMSTEQFIIFLSKSFENLVKYSKNGSLHYIFMDWGHIKEIILAGEIYEELKNLCIWNKDNGGMGSLYRSKHELIFIFKHGTAAHINNIELGKYGRNRTNVWDYAGVNSFSGDRDLLKLHPTVKPVELVKDAILDASHRNSIILDSFLGSGTTLIAAEKTKRICCGIEFEPLYVDTAIRRFQELTGLEAVNQETEKTYNQMLEEKLKGIANEKQL